MKTYIVYKFTSPSGRSYIGITSKGIEHRLNKHLIDAKLNSYNSVFHKAIKKYGIDAFTLDIIVENVPHYFISAFEKYWINYYDTYNNGYNSTLGGEGMAGFYPSKETREKQAAAKRGKKLAQETKDKMSKQRSGLNNHMAIPVDIFDYKTDELVASKVCLAEWCRERGYQANNLRNTMTGKRNHAHGLYAKQVQEKPNELNT